MPDAAVCLDALRDRADIEVRVASSLSGWPETTMHWTAEADGPAGWLDGLIELLIASGVDCERSPLVSDEPSYFVELRTGSAFCTCAIGLDESTIETLSAWKAVVDAAARIGLEEIINHLRRVITSAGSPIGPEREFER